MCGRYALGGNRVHIHQIHGWNQIQPAAWIDEKDFTPRYNITPRSNGVVIRRRDATIPNNCALVLHTMRWGLVPHWSSHEDRSLSTINARAESVIGGGGLWGTLRGKKHCVVVADGYYEWQKKGSEKLPYFTRFEGGGALMLLAGLYDITMLEGQSEPQWSFAIITTEASVKSSWLHNRQPVILSSQDAVDAWLDTSSQKWSSQFSSILSQYHDSLLSLECYRVPKEVGKVDAESPSFIEAIAERPDGIKAMFAKRASSSTSQKKDAIAQGNGKKRKRKDIDGSWADRDRPATHVKPYASSTLDTKCINKTFGVSDNHMVRSSSYRLHDNTNSTAQENQEDGKPDQKGLKSDK